MANSWFDFKQFRVEQVVFGGHGTDADLVAHLRDAAQVRDPAQVDQVRGLRETQLHHGQQAVATGQQLGVVAQGGQQLERLRHRAGAVVIEWDGDHVGLLGWVSKPPGERI